MFKVSKMTFECPRCGHSTKLKNDMRKHLKRKKPCEFKLSNISQEECLNMLENNEFVSISLLKTQLKNALQQIKEKDKQIDKLQEQMGLLLKSQGKNVKGNNNSNCNNDTTIINLHVNSYENTNYNVLKDKLNKCIENGKVNEVKLLKLLHFNKDHPENHNLKIDNRRANRIMTFNGTEFEEKHSGVNGVLNFIEDSLDKVEEECEELQPALEKRYMQNNELSKEEQRKNAHDVSKVLYNGRNIVNETHKSLRDTSTERKLITRSRAHERTLKRK